MLHNNILVINLLKNMFMKKKNVFSPFKGWALFLLSTLTFFSCDNIETNLPLPSDNANQPLRSQSDIIVEGEVTSEIIKEFTASDILSMKQHLESVGIEIPGLILPQAEVAPQGIINNALLSAIKVTTKSPHPADPNRLIDISGVLLVPKISLTSLRLVVAPVPTYTDNNQSPSNLFAQDISVINNGNLNFLAFWALQAYQGFAVLLPDYPGFGDSYQECFHPYMVKNALVNSTIEMTKATQTAMTSRNYRYKSDLIITGYSQGAYVATSLARELELNPSHGLGVKLLVAGGTPADFRYMVNDIREQETFNNLWLVGYIACGYQSSEYPGLVFPEIFNEPYSSDLYKYFDGTFPGGTGDFPTVISELFTENAINNWETAPELELIRTAMDENSIQPWANQCKIVMTHGLQDDIVTYGNAKGFADRQNAMGGDITFNTNLLGDHITNVIPYYLTASTYLLLYKL